MNHPLETTQTFIALRAKGWSYGRIAAQLNISKSTAYDWDDRFSKEIAKFRTIELQAIHERILADYETELAWLACELKRVQDALRQRDYARCQLRQLWWYQATLFQHIEKRRADIVFPDLSTERNRTLPNDISTTTERDRTQPNDILSTSATPELSPATAGSAEPSAIQPEAQGRGEPAGQTSPEGQSQAVPSPGGEGQDEGEPSTLPRLRDSERSAPDPHLEAPPMGGGEQTRTLPNDSKYAASADPEAIKPKRHQPYWLNGHYHPNSELPCELAPDHGPQQFRQQGSTAAVERRCLTNHARSRP
jgi:hypothetical protein